ncbi:MAG: PAS domain-containing sensor histidine kinase [Methanoregula sp.]|nr:PAS domain-containing sensor histidine kinase [Methanoregula sp.]
MTDSSYEKACREPAEFHNHVVFTLDRQDIITCVSPNCSDILGFLKEEMIGRPLSAFLVPDEKCPAGGMGNPIKPGKEHPFIFQVVGKDGGFHQAMVVSRSVFEEQETAGSFGIIGEVNSGKPAEKMLRQANTRIHLLNSIVRHDINNQLTVLNGYLSLMDQEEDPNNSSEIVRILLGATDRIHKMVTFTSEYKDLGTYLPVWANLYGVFQSVRFTFDTAGVQIIPEPACEEFELFCDPLLTKVFQQLVDNSLRHGKKVSRISLRWELVEGGATMVYEDNGCGIPDSLKSTLFNRQNGKKTGYGLFLVHELLAISGFTISETGTPGKGVRFEIRVPAGLFRIVKSKPLE